MKSVAAMTQNRSKEVAQAILLTNAAIDAAWLSARNSSDENIEVLTSQSSSDDQLFDMSIILLTPDFETSQSLFRLPFLQASTNVSEIVTDLDVT